MEDHENLVKEFDRVVKRQKLAYAITNDTIDQLLENLSKTKAILDTEKMQIDAETKEEKKEEADNVGDIVKAMVQNIQELQVAHKLSAEQKEMYNAIGKWGKLIDKQFNADLMESLNVKAPLDSHLVDLAIVDHLLKTNRLHCAQTFANEAGITVTPNMFEPFLEIHAILQQLKAGNLQPVIKWTEEHRVQLQKSPNVSSIEFKLHKAQFLLILTQQDKKQAINYAKTHFKLFVGSNLKEIQRLMGSLAYVHRLETSPYQDLQFSTYLPEVVHTFIRISCNLLGYSSESALLTAVNAGYACMPTLLKMAAVVKNKLSTFNTLQVEMELGRDFQFHSIFTCPVSREQSTKENPPVLLHCGHVLCRNSMLRLTRGGAGRFKCPYCPVEQNVAQALTLNF